MTRTVTRVPPSAPSEHFSPVLWVVFVATAVKVYLAVNTVGTNDLSYWTYFADGVRSYGPIGIYGHTFEAPYNHMPLTGWMLAGFNLLDGLGLGLGFWIRLTASLADVATVYLVWDLVRQYRPEREAIFAAISLAASPLLIVVSGFHGNTDPVFVMLCLLALWLLVVRGRSFSSGLAFGVAISLKMAPVVLLPWLLYLAWRRGRGPLLRFVAGGAVLFVLVWVPVLVLRFPEFREAALGYRGVALREWGLSYFAGPRGRGWEAAQDWLNSAGSVVAVLVAMAMPFVLAGWQRGRTSPIALAGYPLVVLLLLSPAFGMQYLTWGLASAYLISIRLATVYNIVASVFAVAVYSTWTGAPPWRWNIALSKPFTQLEVVLMAVTWTVLLLTTFGRRTVVADRATTRQETE